jgi:two-component system response regulator RegA
MNDTTPTDWTGVRLLIVDDDEVFRDQLARVVGRRGLVTETAQDYDEGMEKLRSFEPDICSIDLRMPGKSGLELLRDLLAEAPHVETVVLTGYGSIATAIDAVKLGAINYLQKPADADDLLAAFENGRLEPLETTDESYEAPSLARVEWEHINRVLADCGGNISEASRRLGVHRRTLQRKLQAMPVKE